MSSGEDKSPDNVDSESDAPDDHPVDAVIQRAISRQQSPLLAPQAHNGTGKRKREQTTANADVISLLSSSPDSPSRKDVKHRRSSGPASPSTRTATAAPVGVTVIEEGTEAQNSQVQRLLRGSRQVFYLMAQGLSQPCSPS